MFSYNLDRSTFVKFKWINLYQWVLLISPNIKELNFLLKPLLRNYKTILCKHNAKDVQKNQKWTNYGLNLYLVTGVLTLKLRNLMPMKLIAQKQFTLIRKIAFFFSLRISKRSRWGTIPWGVEVLELEGLRIP